jgi:ATP-dependent helicase/nuclease subunit A
MSVTPRQEAERAQARAADPMASAWVGASAGSGKTKVLTDRVLRLLLAQGTRPGAILCLTFTKAAAAEMAQRLARDLGAWAVAPEPELARKLGALLGHTPTRDNLETARGLFATVLDLPGGMRISTIHAFCQSLLRAFPLEAGLSPQFGVVEDAEAAALLAEAREAVLAAPFGQEDALEALAGLVPPDRFARLVATLVKDREKLATALREVGSQESLLARLATRLGLDGAPDEGALIAAAAQAVLPETLIAARLLEASRNPKDQERGAAIMAWLSLGAAERAARWADWAAIFLTDKGTVRVTLASQKVGPRYEECAAALKAEGERIAAVQATRRAARLLAATRALLGLGAPVLAGYAARKRQAGLMDYDDLILAAQRLLEDPGSAWVLFKLDGGIDHLLLDEAQDSNRAQWGIAGKLTEEFFAGAGRERSNGPPRSIFAVGDTKQSIYGFQGADPGGFARWREAFGARARAAGADFRRVPLEVSFRSTPPVLALVDAVFADGAAREGVVAPGETLIHRADRGGEAGMVELWPMLTGAPVAEPPPWQVPETPESVTGAGAALAEAVAAQIADWLRLGDILPARGRAMRAGDILVLLRKRSGPFLSRLVRALKRLGVPVGGADRMKLLDQLAVQDLMALGDVLLLPEDDLQLAALLVSPLVGFSQDQLTALAAPRSGNLWGALMAERGRDTPEGRAADFLALLAARADLVTPHALFAEVLGEHGGRARLLARLGPDAADPIDEFLGAALDHGRRHPPSLQGFLHAFRQGAAEVKREQEAAGDAVRIMTVHGAKGLQAPVVILPDTVGSGREQGDLRWLAEEGAPPLPLWAPNAAFHAPAYTELLASERAARAEEEHRLLYVALTRAEDRLLVCGFQPKKLRDKPWPEGCWYDLIAQGFFRVHAEEAPFARAGFDAATLRQLETPQTAKLRPERASSATAHAVDVPEWARRAAAPEGSVDALAPSAVPAEAETPAAAPHGAADPTGQRFRRGRLVHTLLQHLPDQPPATWKDVARAFLARAGHALDAAEQATTLAEVLAVLRSPAIADAYGPGSLAEAAIAGRIGDRLVNGQVDRLLVTPDRVLVLDYKTNRPPPEALAAVPALYLRQMAAYRAVLRQAYPGRAVECALVWTHGARVMPLPQGLLDGHALEA